MIRRLYKLFPNKSVIVRLISLHVILALLQGILLGLLVPILNELLQPKPELSSITRWLIAGSIVLMAYLILTVIATPVSFNASMKLAAQLRHDVMFLYCR